MMTGPAFLQERASLLGLGGNDNYIVFFTRFQDSGDDHCPKFAIFIDRFHFNIYLFMYFFHPTTAAKIYQKVNSSF
jgi:hypothetical protein